MASSLTVCPRERAARSPMEGAALSAHATGERRVRARRSVPLHGFLVGLAVWVATGTGAGAQNEPADPRVTTISSSGRFQVTAADSAKASEYTRWAESMADRFERLTGAPVALTRLVPLRIVLAPAGSTAEGVATRCVSSSGRLHYTLEVNEYASLDYEDLLSVYCRLLTAAATDLRRQGTPGGEPPVPDWLAVGLAQNLDASVRNRDRRLLGSWLPLSERPAVTQVLAWDHLPETWFRTRALCGMAALWTLSLKPQGQAWPLIVDRLASGPRLSPVWIADLAGVKPGRDFDRAWVEWLDRQEGLIQDFGAVNSLLVEQLRQACETPAAELHGVPGLAPADRLMPLQLIALRKQSVAQLAAEVRAQQVQALTIGRAPELAEVGERYAVFFQGIGDGASYLTLRWRLSRAERAWERLSARARAWEAYLDTVEQELAQSGGTAIPADRPQPLLEKSRIEAYLDEAERRFSRAGGEQAGDPRREGLKRDEQGPEKRAQDNGRTH